MREGGDGRKGGGRREGTIYSVHSIGQSRCLKIKWVGKVIMLEKVRRNEDVSRWLTLPNKGADRNHKMK